MGGSGSPPGGFPGPLSRNVTAAEILMIFTLQNSILHNEAWSPQMQAAVVLLLTLRIWMSSRGKPGS